ncbi:F-box only protein 10-like [Lethenteron reissneri]|uniref:F-box only protein 10-like n=1 Tax=Lethenteron reissneri TaxID=7753 RepID=UPI002AB6994E|nr:F-box only protein 10-like [Lethenteron reissneri]XP_061408145.1 F-box only protein 10-like [Lethenteron reissneri]
MSAAVSMVTGPGDAARPLLPPRFVMEVGRLPLELWRLILSYLQLPELGRCSSVSRTWRELVVSLDKTRWRQLYLGSPHACRRPPNWPLRPELEPPSWREALRRALLANRVWRRHDSRWSTVDVTGCLYGPFFRKRPECRSAWVGPGGDYESLRVALASLPPYSRVFLLPGVYEEQSEVVLRAPVEIVGQGSLGQVALLVSFEQQCPTVRLCNLVLMQAWFTPIIYKTSVGHMQMDTCNLENGQVQVSAPATCHLRFCSFSQAGLHLHAVALAAVENCEFSGSEGASLTVEGFPSTDHNWAYEHLAASLRADLLAQSCGLLGADTALDWLNLGFDKKSESAQSDKTAGQAGDGTGATHHSQGSKAVGRVGGRCWNVSHKGQNCVSGTAHAGLSDSISSKAHRLCNGMNRDGNHHGDALTPAVSEGAFLKDSSGRDTEQEEDYKEFAHLLTRLPVGSLMTGAGASLSMEEVGPRSLEEELRTEKEARLLVRLILGCVVQRCLFRDGRGGVLSSTHAHVRLQHNTFRHLHQAIRCLQDAKVLVFRNEIHHCRASGVFLRLSAGGVIAENDIHSNGEAAIDIRKAANPLVLCNRIHGGQRTGILVMGGGRGIIRSNLIFNNREAGICILYRGNPLVSGNYIYQGLAAGIAVNENGLGLITGNLIHENQHGGVDIRRGGDPVLRNNLICHSACDGVVIGERGRGLIEGNSICENKGCGVWIMASGTPHVLGNVIAHNGLHGAAVFCRKEGPVEAHGGQAMYRAEGEGPHGDDAELLSWEGDGDPLEEAERRGGHAAITTTILEYNNMLYNAGAGVFVKSSESLTVAWNALHCNEECGVAVHKSTALARIASNNVSWNGRGGVSVRPSCKVELQGNGVYHNTGHGIESCGEGSLIENDVVTSRGCGLRLAQDARMLVLKNRVLSLHRYAMAVFERTRGTIQANLLFQSTGYEALHIELSSAGDVLIQGNEMVPFPAPGCEPGSRWGRLEEPPPRPHSLSSKRPGGPRSVSMVTRLGGGVSQGCSGGGSSVCTLL